jgi:hypothetical protein
LPLDLPMWSRVQTTARSPQWVPVHRPARQTVHSRRQKVSDRQWPTAAVRAMPTIHSSLRRDCCGRLSRPETACADVMRPTRHGPSARRHWEPAAEAEQSERLAASVQSSSWVRGPAERSPRFAVEQSHFGLGKSDTNSGSSESRNSFENCSSSECCNSGTGMDRNSRSFVGRNCRRRSADSTTTIRS